MGLNFEQGHRKESNIRARLFTFNLRNWKCYENENFLATALQIRGTRG
jgi:hypothetical protein